MGIHMNHTTNALCYWYRNPPPNSGVKPVPFRKIPALVVAAGKPRPTQAAVFKAVKKFHTKKSKRGRKVGYRKTSVTEDKAILKSFHAVRKPLGSRVVARDVWNNLKQDLYRKICKRTVAERLRERGVGGCFQRPVDRAAMRCQFTEWKDKLHEAP